MNEANVTPALFAFAQEFPVPVAAEWRRPIWRLLEKEEDLYRTAFRCFLFVRREGHSRSQARKMFLDALFDNGVVLEIDDSFKDLGGQAHDEYWQMAKNGKYWDAQEEEGAGLMPYDEVIVRWRADARDELAASDALLDRLWRVLQARQ